MPNSNPFEGSPLIGAGPTAPQLSGNPMLNMLLPMILPNVMPSGSALAGGGLFGQQSMIDVNRAMAFQGDVMAASAVAQSQANEAGQRLYVGMQQMANPKPLTDAQIAHYRSSASGVGSTLAMAAPFLASQVPGIMGVMDAAGMGGMAATSSLMVGGQSQMDPVTGRYGWSPKTAGAYMEEFGDRFYGAGGDASLMQGYGVGQLAEFIGVGQRAGITPGRALARESVERLRRGASVNDALSDSERANIGASGITELEGAVGGSAAEMDSAIRRVDATKMAKYGENMSGLMRSLEDLFGPGKPVEEYIRLSHALTQGGLSRMSLGQMETVVRRMDATSTLTGTSVQELANMQATAANMSQRGGGVGDLGLGGGMYAAAAVKAMEGRFLGSGTNKGEMQQVMAALYGGAASSRVGQQFAAMQRIEAEADGFAAGSEAEAMSNAIKAGQDTYTWKGKQKSAFMRDEGAWQGIMASGSSLSASDVASMRTERRRNEMFLTEDATVAAQRAQYGADIAPHLASLTGSRGMADKVWNTISNFTSDRDAIAGQNTINMEKEVQRTLEASGVRDAEGQARRIVGRMNTYAVDRGYDSVIQLGMAHGTGAARGGVDVARARAEMRAKLAEATSSTGRTGAIKNVLDAIKNAKPGTGPADLALAALGEVDVADLDATFDELEAEVEADAKAKDITPRQRKAKLDELTSQREKIAASHKVASKARREREADASAEAERAAMAKESPVPKPGEATARPPGDSDDLVGTSGRIRFEGTVGFTEDGLDFSGVEGRWT